MSTDKKTQQIFLFLVLVLLALRFSSLFTEIIDVDESIYALFAKIWFEGGIPYVNAVEMKPLGIHLFYGHVFKAFGKYSLIPVHLATIIVIIVNVYIVFKITVLMYGRRAAFWAALFFIVFSTTYIPKIIATTIEPIMLLPISFQFYWWIRFERDGRKMFAALSGAAFSTAFMFKYQAGVNLLAIILYIIFTRFFAKPPVKVNRKGILLFIAAAIPIPLAMIFYLYKIDALADFYFWNFHGNIAYISSGASTNGIAKQILTRVLPYIASTFLIWFLSIKMLLRLFKGVMGKTPEELPSSHEYLIAIWFLCNIIAVAAGNRFYGHYFLLLIPPTAILSSRLADKLWQKKLAFKVIIIIAVVLPAIGFSIPRYHLNKVNRHFGEDNLNDYKPLALYLASKTEPTDRVFVWGFAPAIYWYSGRLPATRFFWSDILAGRVPGANSKEETKSDTPYKMPVAWKMFFEDLNKFKPIYIVDTAPANLHGYKNYPIKNYPELQKYVEENYQLEVILNGTYFYRINGIKGTN